MASRNKRYPVCGVATDTLANTCFEYFQAITGCLKPHKVEKSHFRGRLSKGVYGESGAQER